MTTIRTLYAAAQRWMCDPQTTINRFLGPILSPRRYGGLGDCAEDSAPTYGLQSFADAKGFPALRSIAAPSQPQTPSQ